MNELLKALYDGFYEPLPAVKLKAEIEACHQKLIERLEKPERRLVLQIIDCKDQIAEDRSIDSFISGFCLAWRLMHSAPANGRWCGVQRPLSGGERPSSGA